MVENKCFLFSKNLCFVLGLVLLGTPTMDDLKPAEDDMDVGLGDSDDGEEEEEEEEEEELGSSSLGDHGLMMALASSNGII